MHTFPFSDFSFLFWWNFLIKLDPFLRCQYAYGANLFVKLWHFCTWILICLLLQDQKKNISCFVFRNIAQMPKTKRYQKAFVCIYLCVVIKKQKNNDELLSDLLIFVLSLLYCWGIFWYIFFFVLSEKDWENVVD